MLLARRFTLNPVLVIISLIFWFWMWGIPGAILSVPMLAIAKIICDRVRPLAAFGHFLEGRNAAAIVGSGISNCSHCRIYYAPTILLPAFAARSGYQRSVRPRRGLSSGSLIAADDARC